MAVQFKFIVLIALASLHSIHSSDDLPGSCQIADSRPNSCNATCIDDKGELKIFVREESTDYRKFMFNVVHVGELIATINLETFPRHINHKFSWIRITNCTMEKNVSFGDLFQHLGFDEGVRRFKGVNIGSSIDELFSTGFENVDVLALSENSIGHLNEGCFHSMRELRRLKLDGNKIGGLHKNVFNSLSKLKKLRLKKNELTDLVDGLFDNLKVLELLDLSNNQLTTISE